MRAIVEWIIGHTGWLYVRLYENPLFFFDWWSFVHLCSGVIIFAMILRWRVPARWLALAAVLVSYEIFEILIPYLALNVFRPETIKDQLTDVCVGMLGGLIVDRTLRYNLRRTASGPARFWNLDNQVALLAALTMSFFWVGSYGYRYNVAFLNAEGLNYNVCAVWTAGIFVVTLLYRSFSQRWQAWHVALSMTWIMSFLILFGFEFISYHILHVREISKPSRTPLLFDTIHGTTALHWYYVTVPLTAVGYFTSLRSFFSAIPLASARESRSASAPALAVHHPRPPVLPARFDQSTA